MAKYFGKIAYGVTEETAPDVYEERVTEREYFGDVQRYARRYQRGEGLNDNLELDNVIFIIADPFAFEHLERGEMESEIRRSSVSASASHDWRCLQCERELICITHFWIFW